MGCGASKEATAAVVVEKRDDGSHPQVVKSAVTQSVTLTESTQKGSEESLASQQQASPLQQQVSVPKQQSTIESVEVVVLPKEQRHNDWKVRPGYSSGASSFEGSEDEEDEEFYKAHRAHLLDLMTLRQEIAADGDIAKTVVRIETPFGKPIEEIYFGVHDGPVLGSGVSGIVRLVTHRSTGVKYAVKCLDLGLIDSMVGLRQLRNEISIMCQLDHPNIVRIEEVYESTNEIYILQELCVGGDLFDRLDEQPDYHYTEAQCARLVKQMLSAVRYLHSRGIIHRDLKLENFLFSNSSADSELKMIDFGLSKHFECGQHHHDKVGTPYTVAPEIIRGAYNEKSDIWAIGVITYLLLSGETPFGGLDGESLLMVKESIMRAQVLFKPADVWDHVSEDGKAFVKRLLQADPSKRPTAKEMQKSQWIQVWAKKDIKEGNRLSTKTLESLVAFKEQSDMQKLLSEVLSFTLLPDQIADLRKEFELIDTEGDGEISLVALRKVLTENAEAGMLGALTEREIEDIFDALKTRKNEFTIRWHEFLAAGLSQARVDERNLRLAFDRLDTNRRGYIMFDDLQSLLGGSKEYKEAEKIWRESLKQCTCPDRITYADFKNLMKGQPKAEQMPSATNLLRSRGSGTASERHILNTVPEGKPNKSLIDSSEFLTPDTKPKQRSHSHEQKTGVVWDDLERCASLTFLPPRDGNGTEELRKDPSVSPLVSNRALYRRHRGMRLAVLEASKQFDKKRNDRISKEYPVQAGLIMKRGVRPPVELEDAHTRALFDAAAKRCGRSVRTRNKTVSDVTGMLIKAQV